MKLSACIVIHNEEKLLHRCLENIKDIVDEIIVVHDGKCEDGSLTIAKEFKSKIYEREFIGEAEFHRPFSYEKASGEWILQIDADEVISEEAKRGMQNLINSGKTDAYSFRWPYFDGEKEIKKGPFAQTFKPCLFRKEKMYMLGISHEYPRTFGKLKKREDLSILNRPLCSNYTCEVFKSKWKNWAKIQAKQIVELEKAPVFNLADKITNPAYKDYLLMREHPIFSGVKEMLKFTALYFSRGIIFSDSVSWRIASFEIAYLWLVRFYLAQLIHGRTI